MAWGLEWVAPVYAAILVGLGAVALSLGRQQGVGARATPWAWAGLLAAAALCAASRLGLARAEWVSPESLELALAGGALALAAVLGGLATRWRSRAELIQASAPLSLEQAVGKLERARRVEGVFEGRLDADEEVTSPGGVVCAFYEAQVRAVDPSGAKGPLLSEDAAYSTVCYLRGERARAVLSFSPQFAHAPLEVRRCRVASPITAGGAAVAEGHPPLDALSYEKVGKIGQTCWIAGRLEKVKGGNGFQLSGPSGGSPALVLCGEPERIARRLMHKAWAYFGSSAALCMLAAYLFAHGRVSL